MSAMPGGEIVARGTWLYGGERLLPVDVVGLPYDF